MTLDKRQYAGIACAVIAAIFGFSAIGTRETAVKKFERNQETLNVNAEVIEFDLNPRNASMLQNDVCIQPALFGSFPSCDSLLPVTEGECLNNDDCCFQQDQRCKACRRCVRHETVCVGSGEHRICSPVCVEHINDPCCSMETYCRVEGTKKYNKIWGHEYFPEWTVNVTAGNGALQYGTFTVDAECGFNDNECVDMFTEERGLGVNYLAYYHERSHTYTEDPPSNGSKHFTASYILMGFFLAFFVAACALLYPELAALFVYLHARCCVKSEPVRPPAVDRVDSADRDPKLDQPQDLGFTVVSDPTPARSSSKTYTHLKVLTVNDAGKLEDPAWVDVSSLDPDTLRSLIQHSGDCAGEHGDKTRYRMNVISVAQHGLSYEPQGSHDYVVVINEYDKPVQADYMVVYQADTREPKYIDTNQIDMATSELFDRYNGTSVDSDQATREDFVNILFTIDKKGSNQKPANFDDSTAYVFAVNHTFTSSR